MNGACLLLSGSCLWRLTPDRDHRRFKPVSFGSRVLVQRSTSAFCNQTHLSVHLSQYIYCCLEWVTLPYSVALNGSVIISEEVVAENVKGNGRGINSSVHLEGLSKATENLRMFGLRAEISTQDLQNTKHGWYALRLNAWHGPVCSPDALTGQGQWW
jgi:hypothetical protein